MPSNDMTFYGLPNARLAHERSCRAVGDRSGVGPRRRHRGGFAAGPSTADRRRARCLGLAGGQRRPQRNQRRPAHGRILLHPAAEGDSTQDLYADRFWRLRSVSRLVCHLSLPCWLQALRRYRLDSRSVLPAAHLAPQFHTAKRAEHARVIAEVPYDLVIVDEAHHLRNARTVLWQFVNSLQRTYLLLLTATPVQNDLEELFNLV